MTIEAVGVPSLTSIVDLLERLSLTARPTNGRLRLRPGTQLARDAVALLIMGDPCGALHLALEAMHRDWRWFSLAGLIGQWHPERNEPEP